MMPGYELGQSSSRAVLAALGGDARAASPPFLCLVPCCMLWVELNQLHVYGLHDLGL